MATPMQRLMESVSPLPQYWLPRMVRPLMRPKTMTWSKKTGELAAVTAESSVWPRRPTMKVSTKPKEVVMRFWRIRGRDKAHTRL